MRIAIGNEAKRIKVQILAIDKSTGVIDCKHIASGYKVKAYIRPDMKFEVGQVVLLEYKKTPTMSGYIVADSLMIETTAKVLDAQRIIEKDVMYTSIILESIDTHKRMHSVIQSSNNLFWDTSIIITGDTVKIRINNGNMFSIEVIQ